ncbi:MAG: zinc-binding alcohol dehydrogenase family protein [Mycobacterium sp.]
MKAAVIMGPGQTPSYQSFVDPEPGSDQHCVLSVTAAALTPVAKAMASGVHYAKEGAYPFIAGLDGVGTSAGGQRLYFARGQAPFGAYAEQVLVAHDDCIPLPDGVDDITAAAIANPGLSSVAALRSSVNLTPGETVLIHGATGAAGSLAVVLARRLGAQRVVATGRSADSLRRLEGLGADVTIELNDADAATAALTQEFAACGVDVVLDYIYGAPSDVVLSAIANAANSMRPVRYCVVGGVGSAVTAISSGLLRAAPVTVMGSGIGSVSWPDFVAATAAVLAEAASGGLSIATTTVALSDVGQVWDRTDSRTRVVFTPAGKAAPQTVR